MSVILLCDPAFRHFGWAIMQVYPDVEAIADAGVIKTEKSDKKRKILAADDNHRCVQEIVQALERLIRLYNPILICAESQQGSKNAHAMQLQGMAWGALSAVATVRNLAIVQAGPQTVKKALCGHKDASKEDIQAAVLQRYPHLAKLVEPVRPPSLHEHIYDAVAVGVTCLPSETITTVRRLSA